MANNEISSKLSNLNMVNYSRSTLEPAGVLNKGYNTKIHMKHTEYKNVGPGE